AWMNLQPFARFGDFQAQPLGVEFACFLQIVHRETGKCFACLEHKITSYALIIDSLTTFIRMTFHFASVFLTVTFLSLNLILFSAVHLPPALYPFPFAQDQGFPYASSSAAALPPAFH